MGLLELIERGTLTGDAVAIIGLAIEHGASAFVAAGPAGAGKSTLANALLALLPTDAQVYVTAGARDRLDLGPVDAPTFLLINELSCHMSIYLCGRAAQRAFGLLQSGVRMLGTLHAMTAAEAVDVMCDEADITRSDLSTPFVFAVVSARWHGERIERHVTELGFLPPVGDVELLLRREGTAMQPVSAGLEALATWAGLTAAELASEIARRSEQLAGLDAR